MRFNETALALSSLLKAEKLLFAAAESCTGGLVSAAMTDIPGSSAVFERGFVTYSNRAKTDMLGVPAALIAAHGAVSAEVAISMAQGALSNSVADIAAALTGVAGPDGGSAEKPVGLVYIAVAGKGRETMVRRNLFDGDRAAIRKSAVDIALQMAIDLAGSPKQAG